jgi:hypothetical protein
MSEHAIQDMCCGPQNQYYYDRIHCSIREKIIHEDCDLPAPFIKILVPIIYEAKHTIKIV